MPAKEWRSANDLYFRQKATKTKTKPVEDDATPAQQKDEPEARLSDGTFLPADNGYQFNKKCKVRVKVEYLKETTRKKVTFKLFSVYNNEEEDLAHQAEGFEENGFAEAEVTLYYGDKYSKALQDDPSAKCQYKFKASHTKGEKEIESELLDMPQSNKKKVNVVEVPDITFNLNSAIPCLDNKNKLISSIVTAFEYASANVDEELVICGHTDTSGDFEYNYDLSELRAKAVKALLDNDSSTWADIAGKQSKVEDYQTILKTLNDIHGWTCDPGKVDNAEGPKTQEAVKKFQSSYNTTYKASIKEDGKIGPDTWKAIHAVMVDLFKTAYQKENGSDYLPKLTYRQSDGGIYPCGESFPIDNKNKDNYQSKINRRVELVFYKKEEQPELKKPEDKKSKISEVLCQIYDSAVSLFSIIIPKDIKPEPVQKEIKLTIEYPDKTPHKQYVNLKANDKEQGHELKIKVKAENAKDKQVIYWKVTADSKNSKRNKPETGLKNPADNKFVKIDKGIAQLKTEVKEEKSEVILCCGYAGEDTFTVEVGLEKDKEGKVKLEIVNWRKLWYQKTFHEKATITSMATSEKQLKDVFIEFIAEPDKKHTEGTAGNVIIGNHNAKTFHTMLKTKHTGQCVNIVFCDKQYDGLDPSGNNIKQNFTKDMFNKQQTLQLGDDEEAMVALFNPPIQKGAKFLLSGSWANTNNGKHGDLTDDTAKLNDDTGLVKLLNELEVRVELPKNADPSSSKHVSIALTLTTASGPWGGDGGTAPHNLIVIDINDTIHSMCVMHELGHLLNMVPLLNYYKCPPGFKYEDHNYRYEKMGGSGSHCFFEHDKKKSTTKRYVDGTCIMFHQLTKKCKLLFCECCGPFVKAQTLQKFNDLK